MSDCAQRIGRNGVRTGLVAALLAGVLSGCAVYHAAPLPVTPDVTAAAPAGPLDMAAAARLALKESPDLSALRRKAGVKGAEGAFGGAPHGAAVAAGGGPPGGRDPVGDVGGLPQSLRLARRLRVPHLGLPDAVPAARSRRMICRHRTRP